MKLRFVISVLLTLSVQGATAGEIRSTHNSISDLRSAEEKETNPLTKFRALGSVVKYYASAKLNDESKVDAKNYATSLLKKAPAYKEDFDYGNSIHHGNLVLGRVELLDNNLAGAKEFLKRAGNTPGSPQLESFGPNMTLAKELLEKNEKEAVIAFLDQIGRFWKPASDKVPGATVDGWKKEITAGKIPNFRGNLKY